MGNKSSVLQRAKRVERKVQQYLWPGSAFAGGAKRPALEREDLRGADRHGNEWWGEVKNLSQATIAEQGGPWAVLERAWLQARAAILSEQAEAHAFAVLWPKSARRDDQKLVLCELPLRLPNTPGGVPVVLTLGMFRDCVLQLDSVAGEE